MEIKGTVEEIRFANEENGFRIIVLDCGGEAVITAGVFPPVSEGESLTLTGEFVTHPKFGRQFKAEKAVRHAPGSAESMARYLGSGLIKGVGPKTALAIVNAFGVKALEIIEFRPHLLSKVKGISKPKAQLICDEYAKNRAIQTAVMFLQDKGISLNMALKIYKAYGTDTEAIVSQNPYRLIEDIDGIGFITADRIASGFGIEKDSPLRLSAGVIYALRENADRSGNTFLTRGELCSEAQKLLGTGAAIDAAVDELAVRQKVKIVDVGGLEAVYLRSVYLAESGAALKLVNLASSARGLNGTEADGVCLEEEIAAYEQIYGIEFNDEQRKALLTAAGAGVSVITGGPGTGKTTIIKCLISLYEQRGLKVVLMAPTGRAAKRMNETTGSPASTIHRAILTGGRTELVRQLDADVVIVDEVSMLDVFLLGLLLKSLREGTSLIMLGDSDQLPSVGAGNVLADMLETLPSVRLTKIYRQAGGSLIIANAHLINRGLMPDLSQKAADFFFIKEGSPERMAELICGLLAKRLPAYLNTEADKIQVLCPMKNGSAGTINLNRLLSAEINIRKGAEIKAGGYVLREGDKVMQIANNYEQEWMRGAEKGDGVFNGDMGVVTAAFPEAHEARVLFEDGREAVYSENLDELVPAYAVTVHKSQGSEYEAVVVPIVPGSPQIMTRNLLYTAVTRAKRLVVLIGEDYYIRKMVENDYVAKRNSGLKHFVAEARRDYDRLFNKAGRTENP